MDLIGANMERRLNVLVSIEFAAKSWNTIGAKFIQSFWIKSEIIEAPQIANIRAQIIIESLASPSNKTATIWLI